MAHYGEDLKKDFGYLKQVVSAPVSEALICVDTRDGIKYDPATGLITTPSNPFDIQIYTGTSLFAGAVRRIKLKEVVIPWNIPNVNNRNRVLFIQQEGSAAVDTGVELAEGFYTPVGLATALQTELLSSGGLFGWTDWSVSWDASSNTFLIASTPLVNGIPTSDPTKRFRIMPKNSQSKPDPVFRQLNDTLATMMGFQNVGPYYANGAKSSFATMTYTEYVDVVSPFLTKNQYVIDRSTSFKTGNNLIARLYVAPDRLYAISDTGNNLIGTRPFVYHKEFMVPKEINWSMDESLPSINIQLRDDKGELLYVPRGGLGLSNTSMADNSSYVALTFGVSEARGE